MTAEDSNAQFREHDIEFLKKRTKLWFEAVLGEKYGDRSLPELISDGNLLYRVSKYITREITGTSPGPQEISPKTFSEVAIYGKHSGKYLPYANADSFLKTCKKVGLTDVELFTPPDAVEGKDIRRVCTSIRSLARKARAQHIRVPDFEDVNRPLPMPKEKVDEIKENLQHSTSNPVTPMVPAPDADIQKSERVQIITRFLSSTTFSPSTSEEGVASSPATHGPPKSLLSDDSSWSTPSTPTATIAGIGTPTLAKSLSVVEPSPSHFMTSRMNFPSSPETPLPSSSKPEENLTIVSPIQTGDQSNKSPYSQLGLGTYRHAQPHFIKKSSSQSNLCDSDHDPSDRVINTPEKPILKASMGRSTSLADISNSTDRLTDEGTAAEPQPLKTPSTPVVSHNHRPQTKELSSFSQLGLGSYRHAQPHFVLKKAVQDDLPGSSPCSEDVESQFLESLPQPDVPRVTSLKPKGPSSNKIVEKEPRSTRIATEMPARSSARTSKASAIPVKEPLSNPQARASGVQFNTRLWMPVVAGALAFLGTLLVVRTAREPVVYEVKHGDTLSKISKEVGKSSWDELVKLNPSIKNPNLIYPSERLKLPV